MANFTIHLKTCYFALSKFNGGQSLLVLDLPLTTFASPKPHARRNLGEVPSRRRGRRRFSIVNNSNPSINLLSDSNHSKPLRQNVQEQPSLPAMPPMRFAFYEKDKVIGLDEPYKDALGDFIRDEKEKLQFFRVGGRAHKKIG